MSKGYRLLNANRNGILDDLLIWMKLGVNILKREVIWLDKVPKGASKFSDVLKALGISKKKFNEHFQRLEIKSIPELLSEINISFEEISGAIQRSHSCSEAIVKIWEKRRKFISTEEAIITMILLEQLFKYQADQRKGNEIIRKFLEGIFQAKLPNIEEEQTNHSLHSKDRYVS